MAAAGTVEVDGEHFWCPVCLETLSDPVTIPCGHSYCAGCIEGYWKRTQHRSGYSCPQCRKSFSPRPVLARNTVLAGVVERLKEAGPGPPQRKVCARHRRLFELFCRTDRELICPLCLTDGHSGHQVVPAAQERAERQELLEETFKRSKQKGKEKEKELLSFIKDLKRLAQAAESDGERLCARLQRSVERRWAEARAVVRAGERAALAQAEEMLELLEQRGRERRGREVELERLSHTDDHVHFLMSSSTLTLPDPVDLAVDVHPRFSFSTLRGTVVELRERLNDVCDRELVRISALLEDEPGETSPAVSACPEIASPVRSANPGRVEPKLRAEFLHYCCEVVLDPDTADSCLRLSEGNRRVSAGPGSQHRPERQEHPERPRALLGRDGFSSRSYWEVEWSGRGGMAVGVTYKDAGNADGKPGCDPRSWWCLDVSDGRCTYQHHRTRLEVPTPLSPRIGVYLDHKAGILGFYCVAPRRDNVTLLHRVQTTFSQPLYPGFWIGPESTLKVCSIFTLPKTGNVHSL